MKKRISLYLLPILLLSTNLAIATNQSDSNTTNNQNVPSLPSDDFISFLTAIGAVSSGWLAHSVAETYLPKLKGTGAFNSIYLLASCTVLIAGQYAKYKVSKIRLYEMQKNNNAEIKE